jgi:DNA-binding response OmpR family regulator
MTDEPCARPDARKLQVLLIEDNPGDVDLLRWALDQADVNCELIVIDDGADAISFVQQTGKYSGAAVPDLAILDLNLPKYDGLEILAEMRANNAFATVPVAVLSSSSSSRDRAKMEVFRIARYLTKPPDLEEFMRIGPVLKDLLAESAAAHTSGR